MKKIINSILLTAALGAFFAAAEEIDCTALADSVANEVAADKSQVLEIVTKEVAAAPDCACEIVKAAIKASEADVQTVVAIVEAASSEAPNHLLLIAKCAVAAAPDANDAITALLVKIDPKVAALFSGEGNPLDFPGDETSPVPGENITRRPTPFTQRIVETGSITNPNP